MAKSPCEISTSPEIVAHLAPLLRCIGVVRLLVVFLQKGTGRDHVFFHFLRGYQTYTNTWFAGWAAAGAIFHFAWSLAVEERCYLVWALVLRLLRGILPAKWSAPVCLLALLLMLIPSNPAGHPLQWFMVVALVGS